MQVTPSPAASAPARTVLTPTSPAVAKLLHALQAEMLEETHGLNVVPAGAIVLPALTTGFAHFENEGNTTSLAIGRHPNHTDMYTVRHSRPKDWLPEWWHPARWSLHSTRTDTSGRRWASFCGTYVMNDFGDLVEVPA